MRKLFFMLAIMLTTMTYANDSVDKVVDKTSNGIGTVYNDGKELLKTISPKIEAAVGELAKGLKVTTTKVWEVLVKQQRVNSWCYLAGMIIGLLSWAHFYFRFYRLSKDLDAKGKIKESNILITILSCATAIFFTVLGVLHFNAMMSGFMNPEYPAMVQIVQMASTFN